LASDNVAAAATSDNTAATSDNVAAAATSDNAANTVHNAAAAAARQLPEHEFHFDQRRDLNEE
jgi:hypothetical protein